MKKFKNTVFLAYINQKGGIGKSTCTQHTAIGLKEFHGLDVIVIDTDFQKSLAVERESDMNKVKKLEELMAADDFNPRKIEDKELKYLHSVYDKINMKSLVDIVGCELQDLEDEIDKVDGKYDVVIIDTPGYQDEEIIAVFAYLDVAIVPIVMNKKDISSSMDFIQNTVTKVKQLKEEENEPFIYAGLLNKYSQKDENKQIFEFGEIMGMPILNVGLSDRTAQYDRMTNTLVSVAYSEEDYQNHEVYKIVSEVNKLIESEFE